MDDSSAGATRVDDVARIGSFRFDSGEMLEEAQIAYSTYGTLNERRDNVVVIPSAFAGPTTAFEWLVGPGGAIDTDRWFVFAPAQFGNGQSSSPSTTPAPLDRSRFPRVSIADNVRAHHVVLTDQLGASGVASVFGGSMGGFQAYRWALDHPDLVRSVVVACSSARTSDHARLFLDGLESALRTDPALLDGEYESQPAAGLLTIARAFAPWCASAEFFAQEVYRSFGFSTLDEFMQGFWEPWATTLDANDVIGHLRTWHDADLADGASYDGDLSAALGDVRARTLLLPAERDTYFTIEASRRELEHLPNAELTVIPGPAGHFSLFGIEPESAAFVRDHVRTFLEQNAA